MAVKHANIFISLGGNDGAVYLLAISCISAEFRPGVCFRIQTNMHYSNYEDV